MKSLIIWIKDSLKFEFYDLDFDMDLLRLLRMWIWYVNPELNMMSSSFKFSILYISEISLSISSALSSLDLLLLYFISLIFTCLRAPSKEASQSKCLSANSIASLNYSVSQSIITFQ